MSDSPPFPDLRDEERERERGPRKGRAEEKERGGKKGQDMGRLGPAQTALKPRTTTVLFHQRRKAKDSTSFLHPALSLSLGFGGNVVSLKAIFLTSPLLATFREISAAKRKWKSDKERVGIARMLLDRVSGLFPFCVVIRRLGEDCERIQFELAGETLQIAGFWQ